MMQTLATPYDLQLPSASSLQWLRAISPEAPRPRLHRRRPPHAHQPQRHPHPRGQDLLRRLHRLRLHPLGQPPRATTTSAATTSSGPATWSSPPPPPRLRPHRHRPPRPRLPRLHPAPRRQLRPELLDRRNPLLDRHPARRGRLPHHPCVAPLEGSTASATSMSSPSSSAPPPSSSATPPSPSRSAGKRTPATRPPPSPPSSPASSAPPISPAPTKPPNSAASSRPTPTGSNPTSTSGPPRHEGVLHPDVKYHYMRIRPPAVGEPFHNAQICPPAASTSTTASPAKSTTSRPARSSTPASSNSSATASAAPTIRSSSTRSRSSTTALKIETPYGACWRRYNHDGYGQKKDGSPYDGWGQGRAWPLLTGERAHYELCRRHTTSAATSRRIEQLQLHRRHAARADLGLRRPPLQGHVPRPLRRLRAAPRLGPRRVLKLLRSATDGRVFDRISVVEDALCRLQPTSAPSPARSRSSADPAHHRRLLPAFTLRILDRSTFASSGPSTTGRPPLSTEAQSVGYPGSFVDIPTTPNQTGTIIFTLALARQNGQERWLGRNIEVSVARLHLTLSGKHARYTVHRCGN